MEVGQKIKQARIAKRMTQEELGDIVGVQKSAIAKYENGRIVNIKRSTLKKLSEALGIHPAELIWEQEKKKNNIQADIVIRMRNDEVFLSAVEALYKMDAKKLSSLLGFLK